MIRVYNRATFAQGLIVGVTNTLLIFNLNEKSTLLASTAVALYILGSIISPITSKLSNKNIKIISFILRALTIYLLYYKIESNFLIFLAVLINFFQAQFSRRQFIDLKHLLSSIDPSKLTTHGAINAIGYGLGAGLSGYIFQHHNLLIYLALLIILLLTTLLYPNERIEKEKMIGGLTKRDVIVAVFFILAITPLNNNLAVITYTNIYNESVAGLTALFYTLGSVSASSLKKYIEKLPRPIGTSVLISSTLYLLTLSNAPHYLILLVRFITGGLLFAAQGILEERSKVIRDPERNINKGIEFLWGVFSSTAFIAMLILPSIGENLGYYSIGFISLLFSLIIISLKYLIKS